MVSMQWVSVVKGNDDDDDDDIDLFQQQLLSSVPNYYNQVVVCSTLDPSTLIYFLTLVNSYSIANCSGDRKYSPTQHTLTYACIYIYIFIYTHREVN